MLKILAIPVLLFFQSGHLTMTSIEQMPGTDSLKVVVRLNYELFLRDYQQTVNDDIGLELLRKYKSFPADLANNYINSKVSIYINKKLLLGKLLKMEAADGYIIMNILYRGDKKPKSLTVRNRILTGLFSDIENLTIIRIKDFETGIKFTQKHSEETFVLK
jgi:Domain of unknown function (DUF6702)